MPTSLAQISWLMMTQNSMATTSASLESSMAMEVRPSSVPYSFLMIASGKEVAKFCQVYFLRELTQIEDFRHRKFESALRRCFHQMDEMVEDEVSFLSPLPLLILSPLHRPMIISYSSSVKFPTPQIGNPPLTTTTNSGSRREQRTRMDNFLLQNLLPRRFQSLKPWHCSKNCSLNSTRFPSRPCPALTHPPRQRNLTMSPSLPSHKYLNPQAPVVRRRSNHRQQGMAPQLRKRRIESLSHPPSTKLPPSAACRTTGTPLPATTPASPPAPPPQPPFRISAGCTACVALKHGNELFVANAGHPLPQPHQLTSHR
jgi:hypothetical protein